MLALLAGIVVAAVLFVRLLALEVSGGRYFALLAFLLLIYWSTFSTRVPLYLAGPKVRAALLALLPEEGAEPDRGPLSFIDLGSGLGGVVLSLARARPDAEFLGVELAPLPAMLAWCRARLSDLLNVQLQRQSLWNVDISAADVVYVFLSPVPGVPADRITDVDDARGSRLHVWQIKARV